MSIKPIKVTRSFTYDPDEYLDYCSASGEEPTQEGFIEFISEWIREDLRSPLEFDLNEYIEEV